MTARVLPITVLAWEGPQARAYLARLARDELRPERIVLMVRDPLGGALAQVPGSDGGLALRLEARSQDRSHNFHPYASGAGPGALVAASPRPRAARRRTRVAAIARCSTGSATTSSPTSSCGWRPTRTRDPRLLAGARVASRRPPCCSPAAASCPRPCSTSTASSWCTSTPGCCRTCAAPTCCCGRCSYGAARGLGVLHDARTRRRRRARDLGDRSAHHRHAGGHPPGRRDPVPGRCSRSSTRCCAPSCSCATCWRPPATSRAHGGPQDLDAGDHVPLHAPHRPRARARAAVRVAARGAARGGLDHADARALPRRTTRSPRRSRRCGSRPTRCGPSRRSGRSACAIANATTPRCSNSPSASPCTARCTSS